ncbi:MAG: dephospho-CoA kinase [Planctomycetota bacterium]|nr:MAG: dephospho-CoA kinase [Planctomycetota bacterium]REJ95808.1 MAG: dephospho-CoA kinase [Planctomycetota bacterium]REK29792.1 MAG: dephospho-CoA kinase [Planctomycetota bacterium]REK30388.1 MAG: dephospho-CoA kinase [Planctomycetota bacterium]
MQPPRVPVVGLIGGVGSGKSSLARWISSQLRVSVIDADGAGHRALAQPEVRELIRRRFGEEVFDDKGGIRRDRLADLVFGADETSRQNRRDLETIVHPVIGEDLRRQMEIARCNAGVDLILLDAAVLLEAGWKELCDAVVFVDAPLEQRLKRVREGRGWSASELQQREQSQLSLTEKREAADVIVDNAGSIEQAGRQLLNWIKQQLPANS